MEIKAKCRYDSEAVRTLTRFSQSGKSDPKIRLTLYEIICALLATLTVTEIIIFGMVPISIIMLSLISLRK